MWFSKVTKPKINPYGLQRLHTLSSVLILLLKSSDQNRVNPWHFITKFVSELHLHALCVYKVGIWITMFNRSMSLPNCDVDRGLNYCDNSSPVQVRQCHQLVKYLHVGTSNMSIDLSDFCKRLLLIEEKKIRWHIVGEF